MARKQQIVIKFCPNLRNVLKKFLKQKRLTFLQCLRNLKKLENSPKSVLDYLKPFDL